ncbi:hypothetical protein C1646_722917 [Rhizophagus diaphanus]|nr:hypothetical protein C1646_722917 [Rhizophagus diaphanus] [Rhizophagus sp. MUCL 43196]
MAQYRDDHLFTQPGGPLIYGQTSRGGYTFGTPTQRTAYMAPRPGYGVPLVGIYISPMAAPVSVLRALRVLGGEGSGDDKKHDTELDKNALLSRWIEEIYNEPSINSQHEDKLAHRTSPATEIKTEHGEKDDDTDLPADLKLKLQKKERERSHGRDNRERERERERERDRDRDRDRQYGQPVNFVPARESRRESYIERRWQHTREETMATNREREAERDLDLAEWGDDIEADSGQEEYYKDRNLTLDTIGASQNNSVKPKLTLNLASKRHAALMALDEDEEFDDEEGIESKRKRRILVPLKYSDNEDDENKTEERKRKLVKELVATIPTDKGGLWNLNVKWEELDELQPFVSKKIVEYLGIQEDELVSFIIDHLRNKKPAEDLTKEMMVVC